MMQPGIDILFSADLSFVMAVMRLGIGEILKKAPIRSPALDSISTNDRLYSIVYKFIYFQSTLLR